MKYFWKFPSTNGGQEYGFNDEGIEHFKSNPVKSLAREICQNSLDAVDGEQTVIVDFQQFNLPQESFPDYDGFRQILEKCQKSKYAKDSKSKSFFENALKRFDRKSIPVLRISDYNTKGLTGSDKDEKSDWFKLIKASGSSDKDNIEGGSFGIGKKAPFACSEFRTVFYSTLDINGLMASQGVTRLLSFELRKNYDGSSDMSQATGFYGRNEGNKYLHIKDQFRLDPDFNRTKAGTDIYIPGFNVKEISSESNWEDSVVSEVLNGFLMAIWDNKLELRVSDAVINKKTIEDIFTRFKESLNKTTIMYYEILKDIEHGRKQWQVFDFEGMGEIKYCFSLRPDGRKKVAMVRKTGMKIFDKSGLSAIPHVGIVIIEGEDLNRYLIKLEGPAHEDWQADRYRPQNSKRLLKALFDQIKNRLNDEAMQDDSETSDISGAGEYLPNVDIENKNEKVKDISSKDKVVSIETIVKKRKRVTPHMASDEIGEDLEMSKKGPYENIEGDDTEGFGNNRGKGTGGDNEAYGMNESPDEHSRGFTMAPVNLKKMRLYCNMKKEQIYTLLFTPEETTENGFLEIFKTDETNNKQNVKILDILDEGDSNGLTVNYYRIENFKFVANQQIKIILKLDIEDYCTMEVRLYGYKG